ncbi:MAG: hypothetical protein HY550_07020 [Elusimicrobia bacterium]|nr:hypothetical protein [Elusimicrobiota bacterium]
MRFLTAILLLAAVIPSYAQTADNYSAVSTARFLDLNYGGNKDFVQEYDGRQNSGMETDLEVAGVKDNTYLDFELQGINGPSYNGYVDVNFGSSLRVRGNFKNLVHRPAFRTTALLEDGRFVEHGSMTLVNQSKRPGGLFNRTESEAQLMYYVPESRGARLIAGYWQEYEAGTTYNRYNSSVLNIGYVDRQTSELSMGVYTPLAEGAMSADLTHRRFVDSADYNGIALGTTAPRAPDLRMNLVDMRFRTGSDAVVPMTAALSARTRTNTENGYTSHAYSATLGAAYKPTKKTYVTARAYGRTVGTDENRSFIIRYGNTTKAWGVSGGPHAEIDRYNLAGDLKARYIYSDKLRFKAGYKYENNYRKNTNEYSFEGEVGDNQNGIKRFYDGVTFSTGSQNNVPAVQDTRNTASAGFEISLPLDMDLDVGYTKMTANHAVFNGTSDDSDKGEATLIMPLPARLTLVVTAGYAAEKNKRDQQNRMRSRQNSYQTALEWAGTSRFSAGANYAYEQNSTHADNYWGFNSTGMIHIPQAFSRYENNVIGLHARWELPRGFSLAGNGSYIISRGQLTDNLNVLGVANRYSAAEVRFAPTDVRIARGAVALTYLPPGHKDLSCRLGYRRDMWIDKVYFMNSGWASTVDLSASAKF